MWVLTLLVLPLKGFQDGGDPGAEGEVRRGGGCPRGELQVWWCRASWG